MLIKNNFRIGKNSNNYFHVQQILIHKDFISSSTVQLQNSTSISTTVTVAATKCLLVRDKMNSKMWGISSNNL